MKHVFVSPVPTEDIGKVWHLAKPLLTQATDRSGGRESSEALYSKIKSGSSRLWVIYIDGAMVGSATTEVNQYHEYRSLYVSFLGGSEMSEWLEELIAQLKIYAETNNCQTIEQTGRKGWTRELSKYGFKPEPFVTSKLVL